MSEPSSGLTLDARFAASNAEMVARITTKWAIVTLYITAACAFLGVAKSNTSTHDVQWLALAVPSLGAAAAWIIFIQDAYIYSLIHFQATCESRTENQPDLRYNMGGWMAGDMKRQWWWQYAILLVIFIGLNLVTFLVTGHRSCIGVASISIGTVLSAAALLRSIRWGRSAQKKIINLRQLSGSEHPDTTRSQRA